MVSATDFVKVLRDHSQILQPAYSGAPVPDFDPLRINASMFPANLNCKFGMNYVVKEDPTTFKMDWTSLGWGDTQLLYDEIIRWAKAWATKLNGITPGEEAKISIYLHDRFESREEAHTFLLSGGPKKDFDIPEQVDDDREDR